MPEQTEIQLRVDNKKKVSKYSGSAVSEETYKFKLVATNVDFIDSVKIKSSKDFAQEDDTFSFRALVTQENLEQIVEDASSPEDDEEEE